MSVNVARIYEETIRKGLPYCRICLRSKSQTTLVKPRNAVNFTNGMRLNLFDKNGINTVCFFCEALAGNALRFYQACINAVSIKTVNTELKKMKENDPVPNWLRTSITSCNGNLKEYRSRTTLLQTEVLAIDTSGVEQVGWASDLDNPVSVPVTNAPLCPQRSSDIETVVLDDEDEENPRQVKHDKIDQVASDNAALPKMPKLVPIEKLLETTSANTNNVAALLPNQMQIISRHSSQANHFILHPVVLGKQGTLVVPSLGCEVINGQLVSSENTNQNVSSINDINPATTGTPYLNFVQNPSQANAADSIELVIPNRQAVLIPNQKTSNENDTTAGVEDIDRILKKFLEDSVLEQSKKRTAIENSLSSSAKKKRNNNFLDTDAINTYEKNNTAPIAVISSVIGNSGGIAKITEVKSQAVGPIEKTGKIDWEDKIPMDVISFMDATDPNNIDNILPHPTPAGRQSTTANTTPHSKPDTTPVVRIQPNINTANLMRENRQDHNIIDLC